MSAPLQPGSTELETARTRVASLRWFHDYEVIPGVRTGGVSDMDARGPFFPVPGDLTGQRVLDIGCADGYFTFLAESRGAEVTSIDLWPRRGFFLGQELRRSRAQFKHMSVYDLDPQTMGTFDLVLFCGVLYHTKHPLLALERVASVTRGIAIVESEVWPSPPAPSVSCAAFLERDSLNGDPTNWWVPTAQTLVEMVRAAGFPRAALSAEYGGTRAVVKASMGARTSGRRLDEDLVVTVDRPRMGEVVGPDLDVSGWALSQGAPQTGITRIRITVDDPDPLDGRDDLGDATLGRPRPDLAQEFGDAYGAAGFAVHVALEDAAPGPHTLFVVAEGPGGWNYRAVPIVVGGQA